MNGEIHYKQELLNAHRRRLQALEINAAQHGIDTKPEILNEIVDIKTIIQNIEQELLIFGRA